MENVQYISRYSNLVNIFPFAHILISDASSALYEFQNFGYSIETGRKKSGGVKASASKLDGSKIIFSPAFNLESTILSIINAKSHEQYKEISSNLLNGAEIVAKVVNEFLKETKPKMRPRN